MALRIWQCKTCNEVIKTFKNDPIHCNEIMDLQLAAPQAKMLEPRTPGGKSVLKDQNKILRARSRDHTRDFELDELIANNSKDLARKNMWITDKGRKRTRIDDI